MRRFLFISVTFLVLTGSAFGADYPVDKGSLMVSGMFSFGNWSGELYEDDEGNSKTALTFAPSVLTFVVPNFASGGNLLFERVSQGGASATALAIGPKLLYFVGGSSSRAYPYFGVGFNYLRQTSKVVEYGSSNTRKTHEFTISGTKFILGAGVTLMVSSHLAILWEGAYNVDNLKPEHGEPKSGNVFAIFAGLAGFLF